MITQQAKFYKGTYDIKEFIEITDEVLTKHEKYDKQGRLIFERHDMHDDVYKTYKYHKDTTIVKEKKQYIEPSHELIAIAKYDKLGRTTYERYGHDDIYIYRYYKDTDDVSFRDHNGNWKRFYYRNGYLTRIANHDGSYSKYKKDKKGYVFLTIYDTSGNILKTGYPGEIRNMIPKQPTNANSKPHLNDKRYKYNDNTKSYIR